MAKDITAASPAEKRIAPILKALHKSYTVADCALTWSTPLELLIATILSAQCTDVRVNLVTADLFRKYRTAKDLANVDPATLENDIRSTGFYHQKAKSIIGTCRAIVERFGGQVPQTMDELTTLPGVARKTANVVLGTAFGLNEGMAVDTHVGRIAFKLGLTTTAKDTKDAVRIEQDLLRLVPRNEWTFFSHAIIFLGRQICSARKPNHADCPLRQWCPSANDDE